MRGVYEASANISAVVAGATLLYVTAPANKVIEILGAAITNESNESNEQLEACLQRVGTLGTPTATTLTAAKMESGDQAAGATVKGPVTASEPTYSASTEIGRAGFASLAGWHYTPTPEERPVVAGGDTLGLRLLTSTLTAADLVARIVWREIG